jgi:hypothetical protein
VDGQRNDRLGREEQFHQSEHRRQILRRSSTYTYTHFHAQSDTHTEGRANAEAASYTGTAPNLAMKETVLVIRDR